MNCVYPGFCTSHLAGGNLVTDNQLDISEDLEDELLLDKVDSMLHRHRREQSSLIQLAEKPDTKQASFEESLVFGAEPAEESQPDAAATPATDEIPVLTDQVILTMGEWPEQTEISELLYFAFDAALRETSISLNPAERLTLIQALGKRLPKNL